MIWIDSKTSEEEVMALLRNNFGLGKRNAGEYIVPTMPYKRPFTLKETKVLGHYFGNEFKWTDIDANGKIILYPIDSKVQRGKHYITQEDLKEELKKW